MPSAGAPPPSRAGASAAALDACDALAARLAAAAPHRVRARVPQAAIEAAVKELLAVKQALAAATGEEPADGKKKGKSAAAAGAAASDEAGAGEEGEKKLSKKEQRILAKQREEVRPATRGGRAQLRVAVLAIPSRPGRRATLPLRAC